MNREPFVLLVPVKALDAAKRRLALDAATTRRLMRAFAEDALAAAARSPLVEVAMVVGAEPAVGERWGVPVLPDEGAGDLNRALVMAARRVRAQRPGVGVAAMCADLPCLAEADLTRALVVGAGSRWFVADAAGSGTTLLVAAPGTELGPHFGRGSAASHAASGATPVPDDLPTLRLDVDTTADLDRAVALGVGPHTASALALCDRA